MVQSCWCVPHAHSTSVLCGHVCHWADWAGYPGPGVQSRVTGSEARRASRRPPNTAFAPKAWSWVGRPVGVRLRLSPGGREAMQSHRNPQVRWQKKQPLSSGTVLRALQGQWLHLHDNPFSGPLQRSLQPGKLQDLPKVTWLVGSQTETTTQDFLTPGPCSDHQASHPSRAVRV